MLYNNMFRQNDEKDKSFVSPNLVQQKIKLTSVQEAHLVNYLEGKTFSAFNLIELTNKMLSKEEKKLPIKEIQRKLTKAKENTKQAKTKYNHYQTADALEGITTQQLETAQMDVINGMQKCSQYRNLIAFNLYKDLEKKLLFTKDFFLKESFKLLTDFGNNKMFITDDFFKLLQLIRFIRGDIKGEANEFYFQLIKMKSDYCRLSHFLEEQNKQLTINSNSSFIQTTNPYGEIYSTLETYTQKFMQAFPDSEDEDEKKNPPSQINSFEKKASTTKKIQQVPIGSFHFMNESYQDNLEKRYQAAISALKSNVEFFKWLYDEENIFEVSAWVQKNNDLSNGLFDNLFRNIFNIPLTRAGLRGALFGVGENGGLEEGDQKLIRELLADDFGEYNDDRKKSYKLHPGHRKPEPLINILPKLINNPAVIEWYKQYKYVIKINLNDDKIKSQI